MKKFLILFLPLILICTATWMLVARIQIPSAKEAPIKIVPNFYKETEAPPIQQPIESALAPSLYTAEGGSSSSAQVPQKWLNNGNKAPKNTNKTKTPGRELTR